MSIEETRKRREAKQAPTPAPAPAVAPLDTQELQKIIREALQDELQLVREQLKSLQVSIDLLTMDVLNTAKANERQQDQGEPDSEEEADQNNQGEQGSEEGANQQEELTLQQPPRPESPVQRLRPGPQAIPLGAIPPAGRVWIEPRRQRGAQS